MTKTKHLLSTAAISLQQYEAEMNDLVRAKTEVECLIEDYMQSSEATETRRLEAAEQLAAIERRVGQASARLAEVSAELVQRVAEEREAKQQ